MNTLKYDFSFDIQRLVEPVRYGRRRFGGVANTTAPGLAFGAWPYSHDVMVLGPRSERLRSTHRGWDRVREERAWPPSMTVCHDSTGRASIVQCNRIE